MSFFEDYFELESYSGEVAVCCPFPHNTESGLEYYETHPSAHINLDDRLFHCKVCGQGLNEVQAIEKLLECPFIHAKKLNYLFENSEYREDWERETLSKDSIEKANSLEIHYKN